MSQYGYKLTPKGRQIIEDEDTKDFGLYLWQMPDGAFIADDDRNFLNIPSVRGDMHKINILMNAVKQFGIETGRPVFLSGHSQVTDEEYQEQMERMKSGLIADPLDVGAYKDELKGRKNGR